MAPEHDPATPSSEDVAVLAEHAAGALVGLRAGEVLGAIAENLPGASALAALQTAFPDFTARTPCLSEVLTLLDSDDGSQPPGAHDVIPEWAAAAVATGIQVRADPIDGLAAAVGARLPATWRDRLSHAGAAAVAAAVSAAMDQASWSQCLSLAVAAADAVESAPDDAYVPGASVGARLAWGHALATRAGDDALSVIELLVGTSAAAQEAVPAAFAVVGAELGRVPDASGAASGTEPQPLRITRSAASLGGRATLVAALAGSLAGALAGVTAFPAHVRDDLDLATVVRQRVDDSLPGREAPM